MRLPFFHRDSRPTAADVARRLIVLKHIVVYALMTPPRDLLQTAMATWSDDDRRQFSDEAESRGQEYWGRLLSVRLHRELSPKEKEFAATTLLTMSHAQQADASWRMEAVHVLIWALDIVPSLPPFDAMTDHELLNVMPEPSHLLQTARLRPKQDIDRAREIAELWHWRSHTRWLIENGQPLNPAPWMRDLGLHTFDEIVRFTARAAAEDGTIDTLVDEDFGVRGMSYRAMSNEDWSEVRSITTERHFALNWLCGFAPGNRWDETPTDT